MVSEILQNGIDDLLLEGFYEPIIQKSSTNKYQVVNKSKKRVGLLFTLINLCVMKMILNRLIETLNPKIPA